MNRLEDGFQPTRGAMGDHETNVFCSPWSESPGLPLKEIVRRRRMTVERLAVSEALRRTAGNKARAARLLGISCATLRSKMKLYDIRIVVHVFSQSAA